MFGADKWRSHSTLTALRLSLRLQREAQVIARLGVKCHLRRHAIADLQTVVDKSPDDKLDALFIVRRKRFGWIRLGVWGGISWGMGEKHDLSGFKNLMQAWFGAYSP